MEKWLKNALEYSGSWLEFQMRQSRQPGCVFAVAYKGRVVLEQAYGHANAITGKQLTPRHRFRVASHSKTFTAAAILKLRESGHLKLDDPVGCFVNGLHADIAKVTLGQLLSHSGGLVRDGADGTQWSDDRPFADKEKLLADLAEGPVITPDTQLKYSNHGFGLLGLVIEAITGKPYADWVSKHIVAPSRLKETVPDAVLCNATIACGHSPELPLGYRVIIPGESPTNALAPATGFVSTAADLVTFFASLDPKAKPSVLKAESRRAMAHQQWSDPHGAIDTAYGLGLMMGKSGDWKWVGHTGAFMSGLSITCLLPGRDICFSILGNATDTPVGPWSNGILEILKQFAKNPLPATRTRLWTGRWWGMFQPQPRDLVPFGNQVLVTSPGQLNPFAAAEQITVTAKNTGVISQASGYRSHGEAARLVTGKGGEVQEVWLGGFRLLSERKNKAKLKRKYASQADQAP